MLTRFRPAVETLDERALPSAVLTSSASHPPVTTATVQLADPAPADIVLQADLITAKEAPKPKPTPKPDDTLKIELTDVLISSYQTSGASKVTYQDFHFTSNVSKASPG